MPCPRRLRPWLASLLGLGWLLSLALPGVHAGAFRVAEMRPRDPRAAALWQHPQVAQAVRVWSAVATELFRLPTDITVTPAPCGRIDGFYDPGQQLLHLCEELLTYYAGVLTPPGGNAVDLSRLFHLPLPVGLPFIGRLFVDTGARRALSLGFVVFDLADGVEQFLQEDEGMFGMCGSQQRGVACEAQEGVLELRLDDTLRGFDRL